MSDTGHSSVNLLLDQIDDLKGAHGRVTLATIQEVAGRRMSGPMLLLPGLILVSPLSGIPTLPTILAIIIFLVSIQLMFGRQSIWIPERLRRAGLSSDRSDKAIGYMRPVAGFIDRFSRQRLPWLTGAVPVRVASLLCVLIALVMPLMEFIPFSSSIAGLVITVFGLALMTGDGLLIGAVFLLVLIGGSLASQLFI